MANDGLQALVALHDHKSREFERSLSSRDDASADPAQFLDQLLEMQAVGVACRPAIEMRNRFARDLIKDFN